MGDTSGIRAGRAFVEVGANDSEFRKALNRAQAQLRVFADGLRAIGTTVGGLGAAIVTPLLAAAKGFADSGSSLHDMSQRTGVAVETLSKLGYAAQQSGAEMEDVEIAVKKMQRALGEAAGGAEAPAKALAKLGLTIEALASLSPEDQFNRIAKAVGAVQNPTERAAVALEIFGKGGTKLLPMISEMDVLTDKAKDLGVVMTTQTATAADALGDAMHDVTASFMAARNAIGAALAPVLTEQSERIALIIGQASAWISTNREAVVTVVKIGAALAVLGGTLVTTSILILGVANATKSMTIAMTLATTTAKAMQAVMAAALANPVLATVVLLTAAFVALGVATDSAALHMAEVTDEYTRLREAGDRGRQSDQGRIGRLQELSKQHALTAAELREAEALTTALQNKYGTLGIVINNAAGAVENMANATEALNNAMRASAMRDLQKEASELKTNIHALTEEARSYVNVPVVGTLGGTAIIAGEHNAGLFNRQRALLDQLTQIQDRMRDLRSGSREAITGATRGGAGITPLLMDHTKQIEQQELALHKLHEVEIEAIEDEHERAMAKIREKWDEEMRRAREAKADQAALDRLAQARQIELANELRDHRRKLEAEALRGHGDAEALEIQRQAELRRVAIAGMEDSAAKQAQLDGIQHDEAMQQIRNKYDMEIRLAKLAGDALRASIAEALRGFEERLEEARAKLVDAQRKADAARANKDRAETIDELRLRTQFSGRRLEQELLESQRRQALEKAKVTGENPDLINQEFDLRRKLLDASRQSLGSSAGTFNPVVAAGLGESPLQKRAVYAAESTAKHTAEILRKIAPAPVFAAGV